MPTRRVFPKRTQSTARITTPKRKAAIPAKREPVTSQNSASVDPKTPRTARGDDRPGERTRPFRLPCQHGSCENDGRCRGDCKGHPAYGNDILRKQECDKYYAKQDKLAEIGFLQVQWHDTRFKDGEIFYRSLVEQLPPGIQALGFVEEVGQAEEQPAKKKRRKTEERESTYHVKALIRVPKELFLEAKKDSFWVLKLEGSEDTGHIYVQMESTVWSANAEAAVERVKKQIAEAEEEIANAQKQFGNPIIWPWSNEETQDCG